MAVCMTCDADMLDDIVGNILHCAAFEVARLGPDAFNMTCAMVAEHVADISKSDDVQGNDG